MADILITRDRRSEWYSRATKHLLERMNAEWLFRDYADYGPIIHARFPVGKSIQQVSMHPRDFVARYWAVYR